MTPRTKMTAVSAPRVESVAIREKDGRMDEYEKDDDAQRLHEPRHEDGVHLVDLVVFIFCVLVVGVGLLFGCGCRIAGRRGEAEGARCHQ
ncbi:hypothetical protein ACHAXT_000161 [Thalassiosira profunda]